MKLRISFLTFFINWF